MRKILYSLLTLIILTSLSNTTFSQNRVKILRTDTITSNFNDTIVVLAPFTNYMYPTSFDTIIANTIISDSVLITYLDAGYLNSDSIFNLYSDISYLSSDSIFATYGNIDYLSSDSIFSTYSIYTWATIDSASFDYLKSSKIRNDYYWLPDSAGSSGDILYYGANDELYFAPPPGQLQIDQTIEEWSADSIYGPGEYVTFFDQIYTSLDSASGVAERPGGMEEPINRYWRNIAFFSSSLIGNRYPQYFSSLEFLLYLFKSIPSVDLPQDGVNDTINIADY